MKKIILCAILVCFFGFDGQAQEEEDIFSGFDKWQVRARAIVFAPAPYYYKTVNGIEFNLSKTFAPEVDITYFFSKRISAELSLTATTHDVEIRSGEGANAGSVSMLPPILSFQYNFYIGDFKPYVGLGVNYTSFYGEEAGDFNSIEYKDDFGYVIQGGLDYMLNEKWFLNLDFKKMFLKTEVTVDNDTASTVEVNVDPIIAGFGVGMKF